MVVEEVGGDVKDGVRGKGEEGKMIRTHLGSRLRCMLCSLLRRRRGL